MGFWDTPTKDVPRTYVMRKRKIATGRPRAVRTAVTMPGCDMLCSFAGVASGLFTPTTRHLFVEHSPCVQRRIVRKMRKLDTNAEPILWRGGIHNMPLRSLLQNDPLEFAFIDLCSAINPHIARWFFAELSYAICDGSTLAFTIQRNWRRNQLMNWWTSLVDGKKNPEVKRLWNSAEGLISTAECAGVVGNNLDFFDDSQYQSADTFALVPGHSSWGRFLRPEYHNASVDALSLLMLTMPRLSFTLEACIEYQRSPAVKTMMTTFVLTDVCNTGESRVSSSLLKQLGEHVLPTMNPITR